MSVVTATAATALLKLDMLQADGWPAVVIDDDGKECSRDELTALADLEAPAAEAPRTFERQ